jgi:3',5'-cyclic AMP phosphodiesterase CpdA
MMSSLRLAFTADLHWNVRPSGNAATRLLIECLQLDPPDLLVLAGDIGAGDDFGLCLQLFDSLDCQKALVPGNHDIWVEQDDPRGDSLQVYQQHLAQVSAQHGFHYLDQGPLFLPKADLAIVGSINWYDYSWTLGTLRQQCPDWEDRLKTKRFSRGWHNDARFVRWPLDDVSFARKVVRTLEQHLSQALESAGRVIVVTHHPAFFGLSFPRPGPPFSLDGLLWDAFSGNRALEAILMRFEERIPLVFSGHTHRERANCLGKISGHNIGGDYHFKRLLTLDWPAGNVEAHEFRGEE